MHPIVSIRRPASAILASIAFFLAVPAPAFAIDGGALFRQRCAICHEDPAQPQGKAVRVGPSLKGVVGRPAGKVPGYAYSPAMRAGREIWTAERLDAFLTNPRAVVAGTKMAFAGLPKPADRAAVIEYLRRSR